jgi:hypothetical protein
MTLITINADIAFNPRLDKRKLKDVDVSSLS